MFSSCCVCVNKKSNKNKDNIGNILNSDKEANSTNSPNERADEFKISSNDNDLIQNATEVTEIIKPVDFSITNENELQENNVINNVITTNYDDSVSKENANTKAGGNNGMIITIISYQNTVL